MLHPDHIPGRANRDFARQPYQAWGRSGQGYGNTGRLETELWTDRKVHPNYHDAPHTAAQKNLPGWVWAVMGVGLGVIVVLGLVGVV